MRPFGAWFGRLTMAGACLAWAGCGGGDVPDPDSDSSAATEPPPRVVAQGGAQAPAEAPAPEVVPPQAEPVAPARPDPASVVASSPPAAEVEKPSPAPTPTATAPAEAEKAAPVLKGDASGTEETLRIAGTPASTPPPGEAPAAVGPTIGGPGSLPTAGAPGGAEMERGDPSRTPAADRGPAPPPGPASAAPDPAVAEGPAPERPDMPVGPGGTQGSTGLEGPGGPGGSNDPDGSTPLKPGTFNHPYTAVAAFLDALKSKNKDQLSQTTARRAQTEAVEKHRKLFAAIVEQKISDDELDEISKAMNGYKVAQVLQAKSTGRIGVVIAKVEGRKRLQRTVTARKEKEGWKVLDIGEAIEFKPMMSPVIRRGNRR